MTFDPGSRLFDARLAGGSLLDLGIYPVAFATYFMNRKPDVIKATAIMSETIVDESTSMVFRYGKVPAFLSSSVAGKTHNKGLIMGENGYIEIPDFYKAKKTILFDSSGVLIDSFDDQRTTWGYNYETQEVTDCLLQGKLQSSIVPHSRSIEIQEILIEVRKQIGLRYPGEE
jgi:predicted dehydrogenase